MKNKILAILCVALIAVLGFASCEEEVACEHTFSAKWSTNETNHWHAATCEHGEIKGQNAAHTDADENGKCDVCEYEVGHTHAFADAWSFDEENHWKAATCTHTDEKGELALHADDDTDGACDVCKNHVHTLDGAGFCHGCDKEIKPVVETDIASVVSATTARWDKVVSGKVEYKVDITSSVTGGVVDSRWHNVDYLFGTNGTYSKRCEDEVDSESGDKTGDTLISEKWIALVSSDTVEGVLATSINGEYLYAEPTAFGIDDLRGYYFAASTLADGHGPEALLLALYNASVNADLNKVSNLVVDHDNENNTYALSYEVLVINTDVAAGEDDNVNFYKVNVAFSYTDNYVLTSLDVKVDCYTNSLEDKAEHDFTYDQATKTITMKDNASADTYTFKVTQTVGEREEIEIEDGSSFTPTDYDLYTDEALTKKFTELEITVGDNSVNLYFKCTPTTAIFSFLANDFSAVVKDAEGNESNGVSFMLTGSVVYVIPVAEGEYTVTFTAGGITKTARVKVVAPKLGGEFTLDLNVKSSYQWSYDWDEPVCYEFKAAASGEYTFYLPAYFGIYSAKNHEDGIKPEVDCFSIDSTSVLGGYVPTEEHTVTVKLRKGQTYKFYYGATYTGTFTIGYDAP